MKRKVYIESSVVSYYTGRPSRDVVIAGRQQSTQDFWPLLSQELLPYVSALVVKETGNGDPTVARKRLDAIGSCPILATTPDAERLARDILASHGIPEEYPEDALHVAIAATAGMDFKQFNSDLHLICEDLRRFESTLGVRVVTLQSRRIQPTSGPMVCREARQP